MVNAITPFFILNYHVIFNLSGFVSNHQSKEYLIVSYI